MKIVAVIPAHMASVRFPGKILFPFHGLPMIEHVRRRALLAEAVSDVVVATCDHDIASVVRGYGGKVIMTANTHKNGTTRVAEAVKDIECTHVMLLQGDEPLLLPRHIDSFAKSIASDNLADAWNATGPIDLEEELDRHSFVKCAIGLSDRVLHCFRRSPCYSDFSMQQRFIRKILGIIAYKKDFLLHLTTLTASPIEQAEFIEQMRIIENGFVMRSVPVSPSLPSVNEPGEAEIVLQYVNSDEEQRALLERILQ
ncbi:3-deoxy-manno-octulosonate cytidylyltransferase [Chlorobium phaeovibrioides]|uniref:cytidylyltransferase domain-containing protein n=1 Tax=Chlorobium phaeovibrioides TaxID=1094 RepID=UPI000F83ACDE|nr:NTP transferase domain-containing protein [Chlorobium phaeovibrioides]RTY34210.1 3-deoxy-manno-octulosonate cytidylyltransferase [Chlorobium phaeovibrioides]